MSTTVKTITQSYFQATSIARLMNILESIHDGNDTVEKIMYASDVSEITVNTYVSFAIDLSIVNISNSAVFFTEIGKDFMNLNMEQQAERLRDSILEFDIVQDYNRMGESLYAAEIRKNTESDKSASRIVDTARSLSKATKSVKTMLQSMNAPLRPSGSNLNSGFKTKSSTNDGFYINVKSHKSANAFNAQHAAELEKLLQTAEVQNRTLTRRNWKCDCGQKNKLTVNECEACGDTRITD